MTENVRVLVDELKNRALAEGVVLAPGAAFSLSPASGARFLRFNVSHCADQRIFTVLEEAMAG